MENKDKYLSDIKPTLLPKWNKKDLVIMEQDGYSINLSTSDEEAIKLKKYLKEKGLCAQAGYIINSDNKYINFVISRERNRSQI